MSTTAQTVYVLSYSHRHGEDTTVYATEEAAYAAVAEIAREWWTDLIDRRAVTTYSYGQLAEETEVLPETPEGLSDDRVTELYFEAVSAYESYEITAAEVRE